MCRPLFLRYRTNSVRRSARYWLKKYNRDLFVNKYR